MENPEWTPPPPPDESSIYSASTRDHYAEEIKKQATKALIFGILSLVCCPLIFSFMGYNAANEALLNIDLYEVGQDKRGIAQAGKVLSIVGAVLWIVSVIIRIMLAIAR
jgi:hypothetical protein